MAGGGLLEDPVAQELLQVAADGGLDLRAALSGDDEALRPTEVAQPALLLVETVLALALADDVHVVAVAGHSVGEYAACVAAGALQPGDAMRLVLERGLAMAAMREGTMSALLGVDPAAAEAACAEAATATGEVVVVANFNAPGQVVISGTVAGVEAAERAAQSRGLRRAMRLNVSGAFHSPLMAAAGERLAAALAATDVATARVPIVANVDAEPVTDGAAIRDRLQRQLTAPVRWIDCANRMVELGATALVEVGPGAVLTGLARRIAPDVRGVAVGSLSDARALASEATAP
jgi:[acyl-carrier-protein] S-malonyltransferase